MNHSKTLLLVILMSGLLAVGCAGRKRIEGTEIPVQPQSNEIMIPTPEVPPPVADVATPEPTPEPPPPPAADPCNNYTVVKGDTLWDISGRGVGYRDNFQWPLIFKANRDLITDPDLIYPKQEFCIRQDFTEEDIKKARKDASDTPKYVPHHKPRETLPIDYF